MRISKNELLKGPNLSATFEVSDRLSRILACICCLISLFNILSTEAQSTTATSTIIVVNILTDDFASESNFIIRNGNTYQDIWERRSDQLQNNTPYSDTLSLDANDCFQFIVEDSGKDGLAGEAYFQVLLNNEVVVENEKFQSFFKSNFNCKEAEVCEQAIKISEGRELLKEELNSWFLIRPIFDTYYSIFTTSNCDTRIWIYEDCISDNPDDQTGALFYSDDYEDKNAGLYQILLKSGNKYYCRISKGEDCYEDAYVEFVDLNLRKGCMDPNSCNFDPLANLDSEECVYGDCAPDLIINQEVLESTIYLDSIDNDSQCLIEEGCLHGYGKRDIIRFSTQIENIGTTDYIIGTPEEESDLFSEDNCHEHWHYLGYAEYLLFDGTGSPQPVGFKNGFCALDYRCQDEKSYKYSCDYMGISAGCYDTYDHDLLCQWIDVTDVVDGDYTMVVRVNHNRAADLFGRRELQYENNWAQVCIRLDRSSGVLKLELLQECDTYKDCLNVPFGNSIKDCNGICGGNSHFGDINEDGTVDSIDSYDYNQKLQDGIAPQGPCYDLTGDNKISSYDLILLEDCLSSGSYDETVFNHTHCDFPQSYFNISDTVSLNIDTYDKEGNYIDLSYQANHNFISLDLELMGIDIRSIDFLGSELDFMPTYFEDNLMLHLPKGQIFSKSRDFVSFLRIYLKQNDHIQLCIGDQLEAVNQDLELVNVSIGTRCVDLNTTASTNAIDAEIFEIYPNPVMGNTLFIKGYDKLKNPLLSLYNSNGSGLEINVVLSPNGTIDISALPQGLFYLKVATSERIRMVSFVKF